MSGFIPVGNYKVQGGKRVLVFDKAVNPISDMHTLQRNCKSDFSIVIPECDYVKYHSVLMFDDEYFMIVTNIVTNTVEHTMSVTGRDLLAEMFSHITLYPAAGEYGFADILDMAFADSGIHQMFDINWRSFYEFSGTVALDGNPIAADEALTKAFAACPAAYINYAMSGSTIECWAGSVDKRKTITDYMFLGNSFAVTRGQHISPLAKIEDDDRIYQNFDYVQSPFVSATKYDASIAKRETDAKTLQERFGATGTTVKGANTTDNSYCYFGAYNIDAVKKIDKTYATKITLKNPTQKIPITNAAQYAALKRKYPNIEVTDNLDKGRLEATVGNMVVGTQMGSSASAAKKANVLLTDAVWLSDAWQNIIKISTGTKAKGKISESTYVKVGFGFDTLYLMAMDGGWLMMCLDTISFNNTADSNELNLTFNESSYIRADNAEVVFIAVDDSGYDTTQYRVPMPLDTHAGVYPRQFRIDVPPHSRRCAFIHSGDGKPVSGEYEFSFVGDDGGCNVIPVSHDGVFTGDWFDHFQWFIIADNDFRKHVFEIDGVNKQYVFTGYGKPQGEYRPAYHGLLFENNSSASKTVWFSVPQFKYGDFVSIYTGEGGTPFDYGELKFAY